jgi:uncharacterized protein YggE
LFESVRNVIAIIAILFSFGSVFSLSTITDGLLASKGSDRVTIRDLLPFDPSSQQSATDTGDQIPSNSSTQQTRSDQTGNESATENTITVKGSGSIPVKPDLAIISLNIITSKDSEKAALDADSATFDKVMNFLTKNVTKNKSQSGNVSASNGSSAFTTALSIKQDNLSRYTVTRNIAVNTSDLANIPNWITEVAKLGVNRIDKVQFGLTGHTMDKERINVMEKAMGDAWFNARDAAILLDDRVVGVKALTINNFTANEGLSYPKGVSPDSILYWYQDLVPSVNLGMNLTQAFLFKGVS